MINKDLQTEQKIFRAATDVFVKEGLGAARMQEIADRAGINKSLLHYYYRSKERLFYAVFEELALEMFGKIAGVLEADIPFEEKVNLFMGEHISFLQENPNLPLFLLTEINRNPGLMDKILGKINVERIKESVASGVGPDIIEMEILQLLVTVISLSVFPVIAKPILEVILKQSGITFNEFIEQRKEVAPRLVLSMIQNAGKHLTNNNTSQ